jgi:hypothetical protein
VVEIGDDRARGLADDLGDEPKGVLGPGPQPDDREVDDDVTRGLTESDRAYLRALRNSAREVRAEARRLRTFSAALRARSKAINGDVDDAGTGQPDDVLGIEGD